MSISHWIEISKFAATVGSYVGIGALASGILFNKVSHVVEYTLNKQFGDYGNAKKTLDGRIIVSMSPSSDYFCTRNIALAILVSLISATAFLTLSPYALQFLAGFSTSRYCLHFILPSILTFTGCTLSPILLGLYNISKSCRGINTRRWVEITQAEALNTEIDTITQTEFVYTRFAFSPKKFLATH